MRYFAVIEEGDKKHAYGVEVPDFPGCFSAGDTLEGALENTPDAILLHMEDLLEEGKEFPVPSSAEAISKKLKGRNRIIASVNVNPDILLTKAKRVNITIPEGVLKMIDEKARANSTNRSAFMTEAALRFINDT